MLRQVVGSPGGRHFLLVNLETNFYPTQKDYTAGLAKMRIDPCEYQNIAFVQRYVKNHTPYYRYTEARWHFLRRCLFITFPMSLCPTVKKLSFWHRCRTRSNSRSAQTGSGPFHRTHNSFEALECDSWRFSPKMSLITLHILSTTLSGAANIQIRATMAEYDPKIVSS